MTRNKNQWSWTLLKGKEDDRVDLYQLYYCNNNAKEIDLETKRQFPGLESLTQSKPIFNGV